MKKYESKIPCRNHRVALLAIVFLAACIPAANAVTNTWTYSYDAIGRVVGADYGGGRVITYSYDPAGNLLQRRIYAANGSPEADVSVMKTANPSPVTAGSNLVYTVIVSNAGPDAATGVALVDDLPGVVLTVSSDFSQGDITVDGNMIDWDIGILGSNGVAQMKVVIKPVAQGSLTNTAIVASTNEYDLNTLNNTSIVVTAVNMAGDQDGDGLPDWWETMYFGGPTNANPMADSDGDGVRDDEEYLADTNPNDPNSYFIIDAISVSPHPAIHFRTSPVRYYRLLVQDSLTNGWITLPGTFPGTGGEIIVEDLNPDPQGFYRVEVMPP